MPSSWRSPFPLVSSNSAQSVVNAILGLAALGGHLGAYGRHDLLGKAGELVFTVAPEHERVEAVPDCQVRELVDPLVDRPAQQADAGAVGDLAIDIEHATDLRRIAARAGRSLVEAGRALAQQSELIAQRRNPTVREPTEEPERARAVHTQPDADRMDRHRAGVRAGQAVVL